MTKKYFSSKKYFSITPQNLPHSIIHTFITHRIIKISFNLLYFIIEEYVCINGNRQARSKPYREEKIKFFFHRMLKWMNMRWGYIDVI